MGLRGAARLREALARDFKQGPAQRRASQDLLQEVAAHEIGGAVAVGPRPVGDGRAAHEADGALVEVRRCRCPRRPGRLVYTSAP